MNNTINTRINSLHLAWRFSDEQRSMLCFCRL